jgi:hypothetical protein
MSQRVSDSGHVRPDRSNDLVLRHESARASDEITKHLEALWPQFDLAIFIAEIAALGIERKALEPEHGIVCGLQHSNSLRFPAEFQNFCSRFSGLPVGRSRQCPAAVNIPHQCVSVRIGNFIKEIMGCHFLASLLAAARGEGLRPQIRVLLERLAKGEPCEIGFRADGMLQAGPDPISAKVTPAKTHAPESVE